MCGIAGIVGDVYDNEVIPSMLEDNESQGTRRYKGFFRSENVHLGHCRLSINDLIRKCQSTLC